MLYTILLLTCAGLFLTFRVRGLKAQMQGSPQLSKADGIAKLRDMTCKLRLGMAKEEVERSLGKPHYSPTRGQFYYYAGFSDEKGVPFGLIVEYNRYGYREGEQEKYTGRLEEFSVGRIGE